MKGVSLNKNYTDKPKTAWKHLITFHLSGVGPFQEQKHT